MLLSFYILIIIVVVLLLYLFITKSLEYIKSDINNKYYLVKSSDNIPNKEKANIIAELSKRIDKLIYYLTVNYSNKDTVNYLEYNENVKLLLERFSPEIIGENIMPFGTSYTINKGTYIAMCIDESRDLNTMMFVLLHELSHVGSSSIGHTQEFLDFFRYLLKVSIRLNIYKNIDYTSSPKEYCGIKIDRNVI